MSEERKPSKKFILLGDILPQILQSCRQETNQLLVRIDECWQDVVDEIVASNARPAALKGTSLTVHVTSSVWAHNLRFQKKEMIGGLNRALGNKIIRDIKFKVGRM